MNIGNVEKFDLNIEKALGHYVYALRDPRDRKIFYIGKGGGKDGEGNGRVLEHFKAAREAAPASGPRARLTPHIMRILEIWQSGNQVEWFIVSYDLQGQLKSRGQMSPDDVALETEAVLIDLLELSQNGPTLNLIRGQRRLSKGPLLSGQVQALAAQPVNPRTSKPVTVFVFPVQNAIARGQTTYNATRSYWKVSPAFRSLHGAFGVGIVGGLSLDAFQINSWSKLPTGHWEFVSMLPAPDRGPIGAQLSNKNWTAVIAAAKGSWQRGAYLVAEFDGQGRFRVVRGRFDKSMWLSC